MIVIALSVIATGILLISLGIWLLSLIPNWNTRMDDSGHRYKVKECTLTRCVEV